MPKRYLNRLQTIDRLIHTRGTGTPKEFARKLSISESMLYHYISVMREQGAPIVYSKTSGSYYYESNGRFNFSFIDERT